MARIAIRQDRPSRGMTPRRPRGSDGSFDWGLSLINRDNLVPAGIILIILAFCYKLMALGLVVMSAFGLAVWAYRKSFRRLDPVFLLGLLYVADATLTSFQVSFRMGMERSVQFGVIATTMLGFYAFAQAASRQDCERIVKAVAILSIVVLLHIIIWHMLNGHPVTWKYLSDTKLMLSLCLVPFFALEDRMRAAGRYIFPLALLTLFIVILLSGERKALLLLCMILALSRLAIRTKVYLMGAIGVALLFALSSGDPYIQKQLGSLSDDYSQAPTRYFLSVEAIYDHSDMIREFVNRNAWNQFLHHPVFGLGANGYWAWAKGIYGYSSGLTMNVHGEVSRVPVEGGLVGIAIALTFVGMTAWRALRHVWVSGGLRAPSLDWAPLYCVVLAICYCYSEAVDTSMLLLIGSTGVIMASLPQPSPTLRAGATRFHRIGAKPRAVRPPRIASRGLRAIPLE
ncbi:MAG: O-antigen ligase family protein [Sphingobium sp.]